MASQLVDKVHYLKKLLISSFIRIVERLSTCTTFTWLPFHIGQVCPQVCCSPYLAANFGFFELRTFPWSPSKVKVGAFYPITPKVSSKISYVILEALVWRQQIGPSRWAFLRKHDILTRESNMLSSHVKRLPLLWQLFYILKPCERRGGARGGQYALWSL